MTAPQSRRHTTVTLPRTRRHSSATVLAVTKLAGGGWTPTQIQRILAKDDVYVSVKNIRRWLYPDEREASRAISERWRRKRVRVRARPVSGAYKLVQMEALREAGLSYDSIAKVMSVFFGDELSEEQVRQRLLRGRYELRRGRPTGRKAVAA